jgi:hypothetical protein
MAGEVSIGASKAQLVSLGWDMLVMLDAGEAAPEPLITTSFDEVGAYQNGDWRWSRCRRRQWNATAPRQVTRFTEGVTVRAALGQGIKSPLIRCSAVFGVSEKTGGISPCGAMRAFALSSAMAFPTGRVLTPRSRADIDFALPGCGM